MATVEGVGARQAALKMLDSVLRQGRTLDVAAQDSRGLAPADQGLAVAIAGEALRRLPDLDALIDGATQRPLPDDSKARMVLRLALAQKIGLGTPDHALVATALPLVDGGPRRLVHGVLGTLLRKGIPVVDAPRLPDPVEQRWTKMWGEKVVLAGIGSLHVKMRKAKIGRNPRTGVTVPIPPRRAVRFKVSKDLFQKL